MCEQVWFTGRMQVSTCGELTCYAQVRMKTLKGKSRLFWVPDHNCRESVSRFGDPNGGSCSEVGPLHVHVKDDFPGGSCWY